MVQFYFLSVLFNFIAGLVLVYGKNLTDEYSDVKIIKTRAKKNQSEEGSKSDSKKEEHERAFFDNITFRLVIGVLSAFVGVMKLLTVYKSNFPVIGDFIPALCGLLGGASLLFEYYTVTTVDGSELPEKVNSIFIGGRKYIGIACIAAGLLHFICPQVVLL